MNRRRFLGAISLPMAVGLSGCTSGSVTDRAFAGRYSGDELPSQDPIFSSEKEIRLGLGERCAFLANTKDELRDQMISDSMALDEWENNQDVCFLTAISVVLPIRSSIGVNKVEFSDGVVYMNIETILDNDDESDQLGYHRMMLYWTREVPMVEEPSSIELTERI